MIKTSDGLAGIQQSSSVVLQMMVQLQADKQASEDAKTKQRPETQRIDTAKSIVANKNDYPPEVVDSARACVLNYYSADKFEQPQQDLDDKGEPLSILVVHVAMQDLDFEFETTGTTLHKPALHSICTGSAQDRVVIGERRRMQSASHCFTIVLDS
jgi:hypothetical protein